MNPLSHHLTQRNLASVSMRQRWVDRTASLPCPIARWVEHRLFPFRLRHMRPLAYGVSAEIDDQNIWQLQVGEKTVATSVPLAQLLGTPIQPATIVATGPSAKSHEWQSGRMMVAVNGAPTFLKDRGIRPDLLVVTDPQFTKCCFEHFKNAPGVPLITTFRAASMLAKNAPEELANRPFTIIERVNSWYGIPALPLEDLLILNRNAGSPFHFPECTKTQLKVGWSENPELGFFSGCNVVFAALQVMIGLGARDLEIVGMDLCGSSRVYQECNPQPSLLKEQYDRYILPSFAIMSEALKSTDIRVRNASPVCPLPTEFFAS
ncbi:hypothetical protein JIN85_08765 [Luteolibacter pohnpeiensis]|uniref:Uncharacterized protein n=1 Tax=Luteolibacter pohnpeiensis TaxID=454153 RepID=A0A934S3I5_9BACT|nr:hypothetical protein [Luteolibacter pohnpeiensis]MBK1882505.1 hypothetical protein [Luteolibacter pohnpeiensis]